MNDDEYLLRSWTSVTRMAVIVFVVIATQGCSTYRDVSKEPEIRGLLGHRCILTDSVSLQEGGPHWLPSLVPPTRYPLKEVQRGSILRVAYVEKYGGGFVPGGFIVFADIENGPKRGSRVVIGSLVAAGFWKLYVGPPDVPVETVRAIRPFSREDSGVFYSGLYEPPLEWSPNPQGEVVRPSGT